VVHRDLKPANVLVASDGDSQRPLVKLADFGVSLLLAENTDPLVSAAAHPRVAVAVNPAASSSESGEAIDPWLQSDAFGQQALAQPAPALSDSHLALLPDSDADVPGATVSLGPGSLPRAAAPTPPVIPTAAVDAATLHPEAEPVSAAPQPAHDQAAADAAPGRLTQAGMLVGTPMFMAPELWNSGSQQAGPAADIFSFGVIACELLTGQLPFTNAPVLARWQGERVTIARLHQLRADLPTELANLVDSCLREEPAARPKARVLADRLGAFVSG
jgi:serine/threonine protein kinase